MSILLSLLMQLDADQAKAELAEAQGALKKTGTAAVEVGRKGKAGTAALGTGARQASAQVRRLAASEQLAATTAGQMATQNRLATGSLGNLTAQFNDIGVMLAAGQNPLQLALQQGTQITQVIGPMGAAGAVKALGSAFMGMMNPVSLITIGSIAAGAAMFQWLTGANEEAQTLEKDIDALAAAVDTYTNSVDQSQLSTSELAEDFGSASIALKAFYEMTNGFGRVRAIDEMRTSVVALAAELDVLSEAQEQDLRKRFEAQNSANIRNFPQMSDLRERFDLDTVTDGLAASVEVALALEGAIDRLGDTSGPQDVIDAATELNSLLLETYGSAEAIPAKFRELSGEMSRLVEQSGRIVAADEKGIKNAERITTARRGQIAWNQKIAEQKAAELVIQNNVYGAYARTRSLSAAAVSNAQALISTLNQQANIQLLIAQYGEGSRQVTEARLSAERRVFVATKLTSDMAQSLKDQLLASWDNTKGIASVDMAGNISLAADEASRLAINLAAARAQEISRITGGNEDFFDPRNESGDAGRIKRRRPVPVQNRLGYVAPRVRTGTGGGGGGGGGGSRQSEIDQTGELIKRLKGELDVLRETDPLQKEMLRNREALAGATDKERQKVSELIEQRIAETAAMDAQNERWDELSNTASSALDALIVQGESLSDVLKKVTVNLIDAAIEAANLGTGPLGNLFGGTDNSGKGGWIGALFGGLLPAKAEGGMIYGPGSGTSDDVLMWGSNGEFMVNAQATAKHRNTLEAINAGSPIPAFAAGGAVDGSRAPAARGGTAGGDTMHVSMDLRGARGNKEIEESAFAGMQRALQEHSREVLPDLVNRIVSNPREVG